MYKRRKLSYQELVEFCPNLNIIQHSLYWKLSITHLSTPTLIKQSLNGDELQMQPFSLSLKFQNKAIKIIKPTNTESLEEPFQHLNMLCLPNFILYQ